MINQTYQTLSELKQAYREAQQLELKRLYDLKKAAKRLAKQEQKHD